MNKLIIGLALTVAVTFFFVIIKSKAERRSIKEGEEQNKKNNLVIVEEDKDLAEIIIPYRRVNGVRWYKDEPNWCILMTIEGKEYAVDAPGQKTWDELAQGDKEAGFFVLKTKFGGKDPYKSKKMP